MGGVPEPGWIASTPVSSGAASRGIADPILAGGFWSRVAAVGRSMVVVHIAVRQNPRHFAEPRFIGLCAFPLREPNIALHLSDSRGAEAKAFAVGLSGNGRQLSSIV